MVSHLKVNVFYKTTYLISVTKVTKRIRSALLYGINDNLVFFAWVATVVIFEPKASWTNCNVAHLKTSKPCYIMVYNIKVSRITHLLV